MNPSIYFTVQPEADEQLFTAIGLLDRFAAASTSPSAPGTGAFALVLAAMLIALKVQRGNLDRHGR